MSSVAATIIQQLGCSTERMKVMIGAHSFLSGEDNLSFKFKSKAKNGSNLVIITFLPTDVYKVSFIYLRGMKINVKGQFENIFAENLKSLFERETGLALSL